MAAPASSYDPDALEEGHQPVGQFSSRSLLAGCGAGPRRHQILSARLVERRNPSAPGRGRGEAEAWKRDNATGDRCLSKRLGRPPGIALGRSGDPASIGAPDPPSTRPGRPFQRLNPIHSRSRAVDFRLPPACVAPAPRASHHFLRHRPDYPPRGSTPAGPGGGVEIGPGRSAVGSRRGGRIPVRGLRAVRPRLSRSGRRSPHGRHGCPFGHQVPAPWTGRAPGGRELRAPPGWASRRRPARLAVRGPVETGSCGCHPGTSGLARQHRLRGALPDMEAAQAADPPAAARKSAGSDLGDAAALERGRVL